MNHQGSPQTVRPEGKENKEEEQSEEDRVRTGKTDAVPSAREVEENNVDHATFRFCVPHTCSQVDLKAIRDCTHTRRETVQGSGNPGNF